MLEGLPEVSNLDESDMALKAVSFSGYLKWGRAQRFILAASSLVGFLLWLSLKPSFHTHWQEIIVSNPDNKTTTYFSDSGICTKINDRNKLKNLANFLESFHFGWYNVCFKGPGAGYLVQCRGVDGSTSWLALSPKNSRPSWMSWQSNGRGFNYDDMRIRIISLTEYRELLQLIEIEAM